jgi:gliding motility-associated protein GldL
MGLIEFLQTDKGKLFTGRCYGFGASVVIIGALFKIQHWPLAGWFLSIGMGTEAFLFALSGMEKPHKDYEWEKVFPHFSEDGHKPFELQGQPAASAAVSSSVLDEAEVTKLKSSIKNLSDTAMQLSSISSATGITDTYVKNIQAASDAAGVYAESQTKLAASSDAILVSYKNAENEMGTVAEQTRQFSANVGTINKNLAAINTLYELQMKGAQSNAEGLAHQAEQYKAMNANIEQMKANVDASAKESETYKAQVAKLARQVSDLNNVYGNMLNALNTKA